MAIGIYATQAEMINRYGTEELIQATNLEIENTGAIVLAVLNSALSEANSMIDGYLQVKYSLPLIENPPSIVGVACNLARFILWKNKPSERVLSGYESAIAFLKDVARGIVSLGMTSTLGAPISNALKPIISESEVPAKMTLESLSDYIDPTLG